MGACKTEREQTRRERQRESEREQSDKGREREAEREQSDKGRRRETERETEKGSNQTRRRWGGERDKDRERKQSNKERKREEPNNTQPEAKTQVLPNRCCQRNEHCKTKLVPLFFLRCYCISRG